MANQDSLTKFLEAISKKLTIEVLTDVLKQLTGNEEVLFDGIAQRGDAVKKGDSYLSSLYRFNVNGIVHKKSGCKKPVTFPIFVKGLPQNLARRKTYRSTEFFETEINFYTKVWPKLLKFQKDKEAVVFNNIPRCLAALCDGENDYLILEDISILGYKAVDRSFTLNINDCNLIMKLFADFHSVSFAYKNQNPDEYEESVSSLKETYFAERLEGWYANFFKNLREVWSDAVQKEIPSSIYQSKFEALMNDDFYKKVTRLVEDKGKFAVVSHGDSWLPNFMLKYNGVRTDSVYLIDFQLARNSSIAMDLSFFLFACVGNSIRQIHWNELLLHYHKTFNANLEKLGSSPGLLKFDELKYEFLKYGKFGLGMCMKAIPFSMMDDEETADLDAIEGEDVDISTVWKVKNFTSEAKRLRIVDTVRDMVNRGFMENCFN